MLGCHAWVPGKIQASSGLVWLCSINRIVCIEYEDDSHLSCLDGIFGSSFLLPQVLDLFFIKGVVHKVIKLFFILVCKDMAHHEKISHTKVVKTIYYSNTFGGMTTKQKFYILMMLVGLFKTYIRHISY